MLAVAIAVLLVAGVGGAADIGYITLKGRADQLQASLTGDLQAGQGELEEGKANLTQANTDHDSYWATRAIDHFVAAKARFLAAGQLADNSQLLRWLERTPGASDLVRSRHTSLTGISAMGIAISEAGQELAGLDARLIKPPAGGQAGRTLLTVLGEANMSLTKVKDNLAHAQDAARQVDVRVLPSAQQTAFIKARGTIDGALAGLDEFERLMPVMNEILGGNGARTYLVEQVNPAELRAGGGFIGTYSLIRADQGTLTVIRSGDAYDLVRPRPLPGHAGFIPQPTPYREIIPEVSWSFVDSNIYPDFPTNARFAENFVQPRIGIKLDAVISMDYYTVAKMLEFTGPLTVPGYQLKVDATNFVAVAIRLEIAGDANHKSILSALAGTLMERISSLPPDRWPTLIAAFNGLATERHLQIYFNNAAAQSEINRVGWSGIVRPTGAADYMMEVEANYWGNKANYFLTRRYTVVLIKTSNTLHHVVTVDLVNGTACGSEDRTSYRTNFRLFVADTASVVSNNLRPVRYANPPPPAGTLTADGWVSDIYCGGGRGQASFTYDTPWAPTPRGVDQIYWQKQPGTIRDAVELIWTTGSQTFRASGDLGQDRVIKLTPTGISFTAGNAAQATLPSLSLG
jgi:hypothetical protein